MLRHTIKLEFAGRQHTQTAIETLQMIIEPTKAEHGCSECVISEDLNKDFSITFSMVWSDSNRLKAFMLTPGYLIILGVVEMAIKAPEVVIEEITTTYGLDFIKGLMASRNTES